MVARTQILSSRKTRIKTGLDAQPVAVDGHLRYYPPEKQGLRHLEKLIVRKFAIFSDTILQKNKD